MSEPVSSVQSDVGAVQSGRVRGGLEQPVQQVHLQTKVGSSGGRSRRSGVSTGTGAGSSLGASSATSADDCHISTTSTSSEANGSSVGVATGDIGVFGGGAESFGGCSSGPSLLRARLSRTTKPACSTRERSRPGRLAAGLRGLQAAANHVLPPGGVMQAKIKDEVSIVCHCGGELEWEEPYEAGVGSSLS